MKNKNNSTSPLNGKVYALILTIVILVFGTFFYFNAINTESSKLTDANTREQMFSEDNLKENEIFVEIKEQNSNSLFNHILQENKIFTKKDADGSIQLFYYYDGYEQINIQLDEGEIKDYQMYAIESQDYYPVILGYEEAKIMREEKTFNSVGDFIKNFYGKNIAVVGVMKKSDNIFDRIHIIPLTSGGLNYD